MTNNTQTELRDRLIELDGELWDYQLDKLVPFIQQELVKARLDETEYWRASGFLPLFDADIRIAKLSQTLKELEAEL
jgi:hypothetical protein